MVEPIALCPDPAFNGAANPYQVNATSTEPDASGNNETSIIIPVRQRDAIFGNGFEWIGIRVPGFGVGCC